MLNRIKKSVLTKRIHKYQRYGKSVLKMEVVDGINLYSKKDAHFYAYITPGSENVYVKNIFPVLNPVVMKVSSFSDFIVRTNKFDYILGVVESKITEVFGKAE